MKLWKIALFVLAATVSSCGTYNKKPKIQITHVLAVTEQGDTLRLPINMFITTLYHILIDIMVDGIIIITNQDTITIDLYTLQAVVAQAIATTTITTIIIIKLYLEITQTKDLQVKFY